MSSRLLRASLLFDQRRFLDAEAELRAALADGEQSAELHAMLGLCLMRAKLSDAAKAEVLKALELDPNCAYAHYALSFIEPADVRRNVVTVGQSIKSAIRALELEPTNVRYLVRLAELHQAVSQWKKSLDLLDAALRLSPEHVHAAVLRAEALTHLNRRSEARDTLQRALAINPEASNTHAGVGWALLRAGDHQRALEFFEEALRLFPQSPWAQDGALECAKHRYRVYRWLAFPKQRLAGRPLLRLLLSTLAILAGLFAVLGLLIWLDPILRPRIGNEGVAFVFVPLLAVIFGFFVYYDQLFLWLVRRDRAAQSSRAEHHRKKAVVALIVVPLGLAGALMAILLEKKHPAVLFFFFGLLPGAASLFLTLKEILVRPARGRWLIYSALLLVAGPAVAVAFHEPLHELGRGALIFLLLPIVPPAIGSANSRKKERERQHDAALAARRKTES